LAAKKSALGEAEGAQEMSLMNIQNPAFRIFLSAFPAFDGIVNGGVRGRQGKKE